MTQPRGSLIDPNTRDSQRVAVDIDHACGSPDEDDAVMSYRKVVDLDERELFQDEFIAHLLSRRVHHYYVPESYGGSLTSYEQLYEIAKVLARRDLATAVTMSTMIWSSAVWIGGSESQKQRCAALTKSYNGAMCLAYTERDHGTDLFATKVRAEEVEDGFVLTGEKWPVHRGSRSEVIVLLARTSDAEGARSLSMFLVEKDLLDRSRMGYLPKVRTHGLRGCDTSGIRFNGVKIPKASLIGEKGRGIDLALKTFQVTRTLCVGLSVGAAQCNLRIATEFALSRRLYGSTAFEIPNAKTRLAGVFSDLLLMDAVGVALSRALHVIPRQFSILSAVAKYGAPVRLESSQRDLTIILGARFFFREGHKHGMFQKTLRDSQIVALFDGSSEVNLYLIAGQLPLLFRRQQKIFAERSEPLPDLARTIFNVASDLPTFDGTKLDLVSRGHDTIMECLPGLGEQVRALNNAEQSADAVPSDLLDLLDRLYTLHVQNIEAGLADGFSPNDPSSFDAARDYVLVHLAVSATCFWLYNRDQLGDFVRRGKWLSLALRRLLRELNVRMSAANAQCIAALGDELEQRTITAVSYSILPVGLAGSRLTSSARAQDKESEPDLREQTLRQEEVA